MPYYLSRTDAADVISESITTGTEYVITVPPNLIQELGQSLDLIPEWTAYLDNGTSAVMVTKEAGALTIVHLLAVAAAVVVVPKTVAPDQLSKAVRQEIPADGSQDLLILHEGEGDPIVWPVLFVEALAIVDPDAAARIRAEETQ